MAYQQNPEQSPDSYSTNLNANGFNGMNRNMTPSPAPALPGLNISAAHSAALQPGSMMNPGMPSGVSTPIGAGPNSGGYMGARGQAPPPSPGRAAADQLANMSLSDSKDESQSGSMSASGSLSGAQTPGKGPDYVYFQRNPQQYSPHIAQKSTATKMRMELYYKQAVEGVVQRKERRVTLEKSLMSEGGRGMEDWQKAKQLQGLGKRETKSVSHFQLAL
jgi:protein-serine/threonine kinase